MAKKLLDYNNDEEMDVYVLLKHVDVRVAKNGKKFLAITFSDSSGQIDGKYWDASDEDVHQYESGKIVELNGKRDLYQNTPQIKIFSLRLVGADEGLDVSQFVKHAPMSTEEMQQAVNQAVFEIVNPTWNRVVRYLLQKFGDRFYTYPAAKTNHHAFAGGLAFHTLSMVRLAQAISQLYPQINKSLLIAGAILHDLGKTIELSGPVGTQYTVTGNLVGHIVLIDEQIVLAGEALKIAPDSEDFLLLRHMILAHHGLQEYGSPVRPQLLEAEVLHNIDEMDAGINMMTGALERVKPGEFTDRIFGLDNRHFYRPKFDDTDSQKSNEN